MKDLITRHYGITDESVSLLIPQVLSKLAERLTSISTLNHTTSRIPPALICPTEDHVEGEQVAAFEIAVSGEGVDGEGLEGVVEEEAVLAGGVGDGG